MTLIGIVVVPLYVRYMGVEAYGLVGFYSVLQSWFHLLDMGLSSTMARETSRFRGGATDALSLRRLLKTLEGIFIGTALFGAGILMLGSDLLASSWLKVQQLPLIEVRHSIMLMAVVVALRWVSGLYRGLIIGFERLVWLNLFNAIIATARFVLVIPLLIYVDDRPVTFFTYQAVIALVETTGIAFYSYRIIPSDISGCTPAWQWAPLRKELKFSLSVAFTGAVWVLVTQTDKLVLSKLLSLSEYANFTLAVLVSNGVLLLSAPISSALLPRLTKLNAEGEERAFISLYREASQMVAVIVIPATLVLAFFSKQILWAWTGDADISENGSPVLTLYAMGNGMLAIAAFPYYLQYAKGDLKLHLIGNGLFLALLLPALVWSTLNYGAIGAGFAWISVNAVYLLCWIPGVHQRFAPGLHRKWLIDDLARIVLFPTIGITLIDMVVAWPSARLEVGLKLVSIGLVVAALSVLSSSWARRVFLRKSLFRKRAREL